MTDVRSKLREERPRRPLLSLRWGQLALLGLALTALVNAGCLLAAVGAAGVGAAAAGYTYYNGLLYRDYSANIADTLVAVRVSLQELRFPVTKEKTDTGSAYLTTSTGDGHTVRIYLDLVSSPIPAEGTMTRVGIRVGFSGDEVVSARILDQISRHLASPLLPGIVAVPGPSAPPTLLPPRPIPETPPPPLATVATTPAATAK
jgi:hypothetical protein